MNTLLEVFQTSYSAIDLAWIAVAYLFGTIPFGLFIGKKVANLDIRTVGSGNIGATNVGRTVGKKWGLITLGLDALKGLVPVVAFRIFAEPNLVLEALVACAAFLGHCYPIWLRFRGGKGAATGLGVLLVHRPLLIAVGALAFLPIFAVSRKVSLGVLSAVTLMTLAFPWVYDSYVGLSVLMFMLVVLILRHTSNIGRLIRQEETSV